MCIRDRHQALELGNRTLLMDSGRIVFDVKGEERSRMTVDDLLEKFRENAGKNLLLINGVFLQHSRTTTTVS